MFGKLIKSHKKLEKAIQVFFNHFFRSHIKPTAYQRIRHKTLTTDLSRYIINNQSSGGVYRKLNRSFIEY